MIGGRRRRPKEPATIEVHEPWGSRMEQIQLQFGPARRIYTVSELNGAIRLALDREFADVWVLGEISGTKQAASGHLYLTLKERDSQVRCVCFRSTARYLAFKPQDGIAVLARGRIDVYEARGEYQLLVESLEPQGYGALQLAFEQLKKRLAEEGLFEPSRKRPLPRLPARIGIVTSPRGAVIRDMLNILSRRFPGLHIRIYPALVQGEGALEDLCAGLKYFGSSGWAAAVILARGGGSLEDLWTFNEERLARAIVTCPVPVISAVGHETDFTISDFVADLRAPTPSAAAELVICTRQELLDMVAVSRHKLHQAVRYRLAQDARRLHELGVERATATLRRRIGRHLQRVDELEFRLREHQRNELDRRRRAWLAAGGRLRQLDLRLRFAGFRGRLELAHSLLSRAVNVRLAAWRARLAPLRAQLDQLSPLRILERGYAIVHDVEGSIVKAHAQAPAGSELRVRLAQGRLEATVTKSIPPDSSGLPS